MSQQTEAISLIEASKQARSVISSINAGKQHALTKNGETVFWQREEWVRWALDEVLPLIDQAIAATEESSAVQERLELIGHADLAINNIYIFNGYGEDVPEGRTPIYAKYKQRKESEPQKSDDRIWPVELQGRLRDGQYSYDPAVEISVFLKAVYWLENSPNTRDKAASKELRRLHEENIRLKDCLFQMQEAAKQLAAQPKAEKQEPVAFITNRRQRMNVEIRPNSFVFQPKSTDWEIPLYTHPQPKREPLTIEQLREHWQVAKVLDMTDSEIDFADYVLIARDVEALYGIKE